MHDRPRSRTEGIVTESVDDDLVVYDQASHTAHCLSGAAASVWERCDGSRSPEELSRELALEPELVTQALDELGRCGLLDDGPVQVSDYSRREAAVRFAKVGGIAFSAPLIYSIAIGPATAAASCVATFQSEPGCTAALGAKATDAACCAGNCYNGVVTGKICATSACKPALALCGSNGECCSHVCLVTCVA